MSNLDIKISASASGVSQTADAVSQLAGAAANVPEAASGDNGNTALKRMQDIDKAMANILSKIGKAKNEQDDDAFWFGNANPAFAKQIARLEQAYDKLAKLRNTSPTSGARAALDREKQTGPTDKDMKQATDMASQAFDRQITTLSGLAAGYKNLNAQMIPALRAMRLISKVDTSGLKSFAQGMNAAASSLKNLQGVNIASGQSKAIDRISQLVKAQTNAISQQVAAVTSLSNAYASLANNVAAAAKATSALKVVTPPKVGGGGGSPRESKDSFLGLGRTNASQAFIGGVSIVGMVKLGQSMLEVERNFQAVENAMRAASGPALVASEMSKVKKIADELGLDFLAIAGGYGKLSIAAKNTGLSSSEVEKIFRGVSEASAALGLNSEQTGGAINALQQMMSKGKISAEELNQQLGERIPGAVGLMAKGLGVTTAQLADMMQRGVVPLKEGLLGLADQMSKTFGSAVNTNGIAAQLNRLKNAVEGAQLSLSKGGGSAAFGGVVGSTVTPFLNEVAGRDLSDAFRPLVENAKALGAVFAGIVGAGAVTALGAAFMAVSAVLNPLTAAMTVAVGSLAAFAALDPEGPKKIVDALETALKTVGDALDKAFGELGGSADALAKIIRGTAVAFGALLQVLAPAVAVLSDLADRATGGDGGSIDEYLANGRGRGATVARGAVIGAALLKTVITGGADAEDSGGLIREMFEAQKRARVSEELERRAAVMAGINKGIKDAEAATAASKARREQIEAERNSLREKSADRSYLIGDAVAASMKSFRFSPFEKNAKNQLVDTAAIARPFVDAVSLFAAKDIGKAVSQSSDLNKSLDRADTRAAGIVTIAEGVASFVEKKFGKSSAFDLRASIEKFDSASKAFSENKDSVAIQKEFVAAQKELAKTLTGFSPEVKKAFESVSSILAQQLQAKDKLDALKGQQKSLGTALADAKDAQPPSSFRLRQLTAFGTESIGRAADIRLASERESIDRHQKTIERLLDRNNTLQEKANEHLSKLNENLQEVG